MDKRDDGGPAFPSVAEGYHADGMSQRDYFAAAALTGLMTMRQTHFRPEDDAAYCYRVADAMLAERQKGGAR